MGKWGQQSVLEGPAEGQRGPVKIRSTDRPTGRLLQRVSIFRPAKYLERKSALARPRTTKELAGQDMRNKGGNSAA